MSVLPKELDYLEPVAQALAKLPPEEVNEEFDDAMLVAVLRERVNGLKLRDAVSRLTEDHRILKKWLKETKPTDGPAFWIAGYIMRAGPLARSLLAPPPPPEPTISFEVPAGWEATIGPRASTFTKGKLVCYIMVLDKPGFDRFQRDATRREELQQSPKNPWANLGIWSKQPVKFGQCCGQKQTYLQTGKTTWKSVEYLLEVPGGFVLARLVHEAGQNFDEAETEQKLDTLRVIPPKSADSVSSC